MNNVIKDVRFWISIAVILGSIIAFLALPQRVSMNERNIDEWKGVAIRQQAMTELLTSNQAALISRDNN
ncbi:MAG: hypothetical protein DRP42_06865 [Tenericutes bacterium]|nr:MAG: hypothetical protein DRP42_06865 [Mycoplasmatota bacterium]